MKQLLTATVLALALFVPAPAGEIPTSGSPAPAPSGTTQTTPGQIPMVGPGAISEAALSALLSVFGWL